MQVTDGSQNVVASYKYDAWGNDLSDPQSPIPNPFKYVGGLGYYSDRESGLKLLGVRYYDSQIGRFWSIDPIKEGWNWYGYVMNNINYVDPSGLGPIKEYIEIEVEYENYIPIPEIHNPILSDPIGDFLGDFLLCILKCLFLPVILSPIDDIVEIIIITPIVKRIPILRPVFDAIGKVIGWVVEHVMVWIPRIVITIIKIVFTQIIVGVTVYCTVKCAREV